MTEERPRWRRAEDPVRRAILDEPIGRLIDRLAKLGVRVDAATFVVHAHRYDNLTDLAIAGFDLDPGLDRAGAWEVTCALEALWRRWAPGRPYVELAIDAWYALDDALDGLDTPAATAAAVAAAKLTGPIGGARRLVTEGFAGVAADVVAAVLDRPDGRSDALLAVARDLLAVMPRDERHARLARAAR